MKEIHSTDEWVEVRDASKGGAVLLLKHSSTCPVSAAGFREFEKFDTPIPKYFITVQTARSVSNDIELDTGIRHETPQLLLFVDGQAVWNASHYSISRSKIQSAVEAYA
ncbi:general stress protein [Sporosarcina sp. NCCP-2222]|uniref:bacillithiol system redox-active protein YtxJ n=1 Tax=Sporosarcina sp. NCCP-2222 TaxID=2935073 RepID=UPI00207F16D4|nr:bacillithiol system redox-active protein YtxJ [Sporosarcina sp. NCCP-2222]GKV55235.1 general stress protein [Sporosarcina sp. NCCP-2222]